MPREIQRARRVSYFYDDEIGNYYYGSGHPMKPHRIRLAHHLIDAFQLTPYLSVFKPAKTSAQQLSMYHTDDYIEALRRITPITQHNFPAQLEQHNLDVDCPVFDSCYDYSLSYAGSTLGCVYRINKGLSDIAINWSGGAHHPTANEAAGFMYINDVVLGILELLKYHERVLYIDLDYHHGNGVEEAFYATNRVMTVDIHRFGDGIYPGTGHIDDIGIDSGRHCAINVPLGDGITDAQYLTVFNSIIPAAVEKFHPNVIVMQCGTTGTAGDRIGTWNLSYDTQGKCISALLGLSTAPLLLLGGGGFSLPNVARVWAYNTAVAINHHKKLPEQIPFNLFYEYFGPSFSLELELLDTGVHHSTMSNDDIQAVIDASLTNIASLQDIPTADIALALPPSQVVPNDHQIESLHQQLDSVTLE